MMEEFEKLRKRYIACFNEEPPMLEVANIESKVYLDALRDAVFYNEKLTRDDLAELIYTNEDVVY